MKIKVPKLKRWHRIMIDLTISLLLLGLGLFILKYRGFTFSDHYPCFTSDMAFKRVADSYLIKDYEVTGSTEINHNIYYIAQTNDSNVISHVYKEGFLWHPGNYLLQFPKDQVILLGLDGWNSILNSEKMEMILVPNVEKAAYVILSVSLSDFEYNNEKLPDTTFEFKTEQMQDGFFTFSIDIPFNPSHMENELFFQLRQYCYETLSRYVSDGVVVTADFYGQDGKLLKSCGVY